MEISDDKNLLFPHSRARKVQEDLLADAASAFSGKKCLIAHAPTGLGKTAATLAPALAHCLKKGNENLTVFFLTSRHTQHSIAVSTLSQIRKKHNVDFSAVSIIGRKWMCAMPETSGLASRDFMLFCKALARS
jgi:DNA excision repair protein ERCC-2